jgi:hypothetical protein
MNRHRPFFADIASRQVKQICHRFISRQNANNSFESEDVATGEIDFDAAVPMA